MTEETQNAIPAGDDALSAEEKAYFESGGEKPIPVETEEKAPAEATPEAEARPEPAARDASVKEDASTEDPEDRVERSENGDRKIDYRVLKKEREKRQEMERKLADAQVRHQQDMAKVNERLMATLAAFQQPAAPVLPEAPAIPDPDQDIFGATKYAVDKIQQMERAQAEERRQREIMAIDTQRRQAQAQEAKKFENAVIAKYNEIGKERAEVDPDFAPAYAYAREKRIAQLMRDEGMNERQAKQRTTQEEFALAAQSLERGQDPTERIKRYAMDMGYSSAAKPAHSADKLGQIAKGQEANKTISGVGSPVNGRAISPQTLVDMSEKDFAAWLKKAGPDGFKSAISRLGNS